MSGAESSIALPNRNQGVSSESRRLRTGKILTEEIPSPVVEEVLEFGRIDQGHPPDPPGDGFTEPGFITGPQKFYMLYRLFLDNPHQLLKVLQSL